MHSTRPAGYPVGRCVIQVIGPGPVDGGRPVGLVRPVRPVGPATGATSQWFVKAAVHTRQVVSGHPFSRGTEPRKQRLPRAGGGWWEGFPVEQEKTCFKPQADAHAGAIHRAGVLPIPGPGSVKCQAPRDAGFPPPQRPAQGGLGGLGPEPPGSGPCTEVVGPGPPQNKRGPPHGDEPLVFRYGKNQLPTAVTRSRRVWSGDTVTGAVVAVVVVSRVQLPPSPFAR